MRKRNIIALVLAFVSILVFAGCKNEFDKAVQKLGGSKLESQEATKIIKQNPDAKDKLSKALLDKDKYNAKVRSGVADLLGTIASVESDESVADSFAEALKISEKDVKIAIINALDKVPGKKAITVLQSEIDDKDADVGKLALQKLDDKTKAKMADAAKLPDSPESVQQRIKVFNEALDFNPCNADAAQSLSALYTDLAGQDPAQEAANKAQAEKYDRICGTILRKFRIAMPFDADPAKQDVDVKKPDFTQKFNSPSGEIAWASCSLSEDKSILDMRMITGVVNMDMCDITPAGLPDQFASYIAFKAVSPAPKDVAIRMGTEAPATLWVNGLEVGKVQQAEAAKDISSDPEKKFNAKLNQGENTVVLKIIGGSESKIRLRISGTDNKEIKGLELKAD